MKRLTGHAETVCHADAAAVAAVLRTVDQYPRWHADVVLRVAVLERDRAGAPGMFEATLRVPVGPLSLDVDLTLAVSIERLDRVTLTRLPNDPDDAETFVAEWRLEPRRPAATAVSLDLEADLDVPRLVPLGDVGDRLARGFVDAVAAAVAVA